MSSLTAQVHATAQSFGFAGRTGDLYLVAFGGIVGFGGLKGVFNRGVVDAIERYGAEVEVRKEVVFAVKACDYVGHFKAYRRDAEGQRRRERLFYKPLATR